MQQSVECTHIQGWRIRYREVTMKETLEKDREVLDEEFGYDPVVLRKQGIILNHHRDISEYKKKIIDERYMEHAINRIAMELSHFLAK